VASFHSSLELLHAYVARVLNAGDVARVSSLFSERYRDHDPLNIPGFAVSTRNDWGTRDDVVRLCNALREPSVDVLFSIEDVFCSEDRIAYRVFGSGTVALAEERLVSASSTQSRLLGAGGPFIQAAPGLLTLPFQLQVTGIFRVSTDRLLIERWGQARVGL
jgi:hypothetical protein